MILLADSKKFINLFLLNLVFRWIYCLLEFNAAEVLEDLLLRGRNFFFCLLTRCVSLFLLLLLTLPDLTQRVASNCRHIK